MSQANLQNIAIVVADLAPVPAINDAKLTAIAIETGNLTNITITPSGE